MRLSRLTRILTVALATVMLAACGGNSGNSGSSGGSSGGPVTLTWFMWSGSDVEKDAWLHVADMVTQKYPNIKIEFQTTPFNDYWTKLTTQAASGSTPCVIGLQGQRAPQFGSLLVPLDDYMSKAGVKAEDYVPSITKGLQLDNKQVALPYDVGPLVVFYNKDAFKAAGLDPNKPPVTWAEVALAAAKLKAAGQKCPFTTSWISWTQLESFSAWHNVEFATKGNGMNGSDARLVFNSPLHVRHIQDLENMAKQGLFVYKGRENKADTTFPSGECAMLTGSAGLLGNIKKNAKFNYGVAPLPYYEDVAGAPQNTVIGGASLWVMSGKPADHYKGVASFFNYLSSPEVQSESHKRTGYLPITTAAFKLTEQSGYYKQNPGADVAVNQMIRKTTDKSRGIRLGNFLQIRTIIDEELEQVWAGKATAKQALDKAVARGNEQLEKFQAANKS